MTILLKNCLAAAIGIIATLSVSNMSAMANTLVRKNVVDLTQEEKSAYVNALKTLQTTIPDGSTISIYDQFLVIHVTTMGFLRSDAVGPATGADAAHNNAAFLPWHREFLFQFEQALRSVEPMVTIPYWDWTDASAIEVIFDENFLGPNGEGSIETPLGRFQGGPVVSGPFSEAEGWVLNPDIHINPMTGESLGTSLLRYVQLPPADVYPLSQQEIDQLLSIDEYDLFSRALEGSISVDQQGNISSGSFLHNYIHGLVGGVVVDTNTDPSTIHRLGTMSVHSSPYDPVFWLHHSNVDRLWAEWQEDGHGGSDFYPSDGQPFSHNLDDPMWPWDGGLSIPGNLDDGDLLSLLPVQALDNILTPFDTLDIKDYGYTYDTFPVSVPEPNSILSWLTLTTLGGIVKLK